MPPWERYAQQPASREDTVIAPPDPYRQASEARAQQSQQNDQQRLDIAQQGEARASRAEARQNAEFENSQADRQREREGNLRSLRERERRINSIFDTLDRLERYAESGDGIGSIEGQEWFREGNWGSGLFNQDANNVAGLIEQVRGDITQQVLAQLVEQNGGRGASGMANTATEAQRMAAAIAPLSQTMSPEDFRAGLGKARDYYRSSLREIRAQLGRPEASAPMSGSANRQQGDISRRAQDYLRQARGN